jgi:hypothetical protein
MRGTLVIQEEDVDNGTHRSVTFIPATTPFASFPKNLLPPVIVVWENNYALFRTILSIMS